MTKQKIRHRTVRDEKMGPPFHFKNCPKMDYVLLATVLIIVVFGLVMLFSVSYAAGYYQYNDSFYYIKNQFKLALVGLVAMWLASYVNIQWLQLFTWPLYFLTLLLLGAVFLFTPPAELDGFHRWIYIGSNSFQPSEIAKFSIAVTCAWIGVKYEKKIRSRNLLENTRYGVINFLLALAPMALLIFKEPHLSATIIVCCITAIVMFMAGTSWGWWVALGSVVTAGISMIGFFMPQLLKILPEHTHSRLLLWKDPFSDALGDGMQTVQGLYAIGSGGLQGLGIGNSRQKHLWVPEPYNDFIFSIICEELGFIGAILILSLFALLIIRGFWIAVKCPDRFSGLVAAGITGQVAVQVFFNIGVVTNLLPNTGISLPFFSYGGTSLMMLLGQMGILLAISRIQNQPQEEPEEEPPSNHVYFKVATKE